MFKKCFTINSKRTTEDFKEFEKLLDEDIYQAVEIFYPYTLSEENYAIFYNNVRNLKARHLTNEVVMHLPFGRDNDLCNFEDCPRVVQRMKDAIEFTSHFGTKKLTLHLGYIDPNKPKREYITHIVNVLRVLCNYASKYNMCIMIENMPSKEELGYSPNEIREIIDATGMDNLKFILDTGHAHLSDYDVLEFIDVLHDKLYHMHYSDNNKNFDEHRPLGEGTIDFKRILRKLKEIKYSNLNCIEILFATSDDLRRYAKDFDELQKNL